MQYLGKVATREKAYCFISIGSITTENGEPANLQSDQDIFLHMEDVSGDLKVGDSVTFEVLPDRKRGDGALRAVRAIRYVEAELLPAGEPIPGFSLAVRDHSAQDTALVKFRHPLHAMMKDVPEATVATVVENRPMPRISRSHERLPEDQELLFTEWTLRQIFPMLGSFGMSYRVDEINDAEFERCFEAELERHRTLGLQQQVGVMEDQVKNFKQVRAALRMMWEEHVIRPDTVIPIKYLPDLFMACPVWFHWTANPESALRSHSSGDPNFAAPTFWKLFPNDHWVDTFSLFNYRFRPLAIYRGEIIPPAATRRMDLARHLFDHVVIATPYHDVAASEWEAFAWQRALDPYVIGFKEGLPFFMVLARFSDSGTFPLFHELVGDTIEFLKSWQPRIEAVLQREGDRSMSWAAPDRTQYAWNISGYDMGKRLRGRLAELAKAFESGKLFDWLRGETDHAPVKS